jgi:hypothetical protein
MTRVFNSFSNAMTETCFIKGKPPNMEALSGSVSEYAILPLNQYRVTEIQNNYQIDFKRKRIQT